MEHYRQDEPDPRPDIEIDAKVENAVTDNHRQDYEKRTCPLAPARGRLASGRSNQRLLDGVLQLTLVHLRAAFDTLVLGLRVQSCW